MATTTKKSPNAKTKTANAKTTNARSTTKKAAPKKARSTKAVAAKTPAKAEKASKDTKSAKAVKSALKSRTPRKVTLDTLRRFNLFSAGLFLILALAAGYIMGKDSLALTIGHLTKDTLASTDGQTVLASAARVVYDIEIRWLVVSTLVLSAILPLLSATKLESRYSKFIRDSRMEPYRWVDLGVTSGLIVATTALLSGVSDLLVLKLVVDFMVISAVLALIAERQNNNVEKTVWSGYLMSLFSGVVPWFLIGTYAVGSVVYGAVSSPWYVYALYGVVAVGFALLAVNQWKQYHRTGAWANYLTVERNYLAINLLVKVAFAVVLIVGFNSIDVA
jgi:hypothetical protein